MDTINKEHQVVITRLFSAPIEKVYNAWTNPDMLTQWFASNVRWNHPLIDVETKPGGRRNVTMRHSDGDEMKITGTYLELIPNQRIVFTWLAVDMHMGDDPTQVTIDLKSTSDGTELTLTHDRLVDPNVRQGTSDGWNGCFEMLEAYLIDGESPLGKHVP